jgi:transposase-like protein
MNYSEGFIARQVRRMAGPEGISASALAKEVGVPQPTLSRWLRAASTVEPMKRKPSKKDTTPRRKTWTAEEKLRVLARAAELHDDELGEFLRTEGVHEATLRQWKDAATTALAGPTKPSKGKKSPEAKQLAELKRELHRKEKALAEMAALITLQKKVRAIWGDEDDDTSTKSET